LRVSVLYIKEGCFQDLSNSGSKQPHPQGRALVLSF
jgi:hypothetical protein